MEYNHNDIINISLFLCGKKGIDIPDEIYLDETKLYEICVDLELDADFIYEEKISIDKETEMFLLKCAQDEKLDKFINYYMETYLNKYITELTQNGYNFLLIKNDIYIHINSLWSIPKKEFVYKNNKWEIGNVKFKEYDKLGEGGFSTVYKNNPPTKPQKVYKVLNEKEKSNIGSVHRFIREYDIMKKHNESGYTIRVYDLNKSELVYSMEYAYASLEEYIKSGKITNIEKDEIIKRCIECMMYLHDEGVLHRDFHPGNILLNRDKHWVVTDFGLAKDITDKYSRQTSTTHAVGRFWFTDPLQLEALKEGSFSTDMYSLAKTIDYVMNENKSGKVHKYSSIVYKAIGPEVELRYENIHEMYDDIVSILDMPTYESAEEIVDKIIENYKRTRKYDLSILMDIFLREDKGKLLFELILRHKTEFAKPYAEIVKVNYLIGINILKEANDYMKSSYKNWNDYDTFANWANSVLYNRKSIQDEINFQLADIIEYIANSVDRFAIKSLSNRIKSDTTVDSHIRAILTYHDGY
ncbi:serine/threonine protein kinase [Clostridium beijerinckii]|uniref:protein kinase domain-containing protein n=1 Tax=Clostridium beijerinckii TaxID=1520 RepID=UPI001493E1DB|nr:protein kinase [Clostridium beijerinckii]NOW83959.1 serine/threonine protein kinase [Clostridium beijerinckii]